MSFGAAAMGVDAHPLPITSTPITSSAHQHPQFPTSSFLICLFVYLPILFLFLRLIHIIYLDYQTFLKLGRGGVPYNIFGYLYITILYKPWVLKNTYEPPLENFHNNPTHISPIFSNNGKSLSLPRRQGERPIVKGIIPQRQLTQAPKEGMGMFQRLHCELAQLMEQFNTTADTLSPPPPRILKTGQSCKETHSDGLFWSPPTPYPPHPTQGGFAGTERKHTCNPLTKDTEICHIHAIDTSTHITLHPSDAGHVLQMGWGERHPLSNGHRWFGRWQGKFLAEGFVLVYAPRDEEEVEVWSRIVRAGMVWNRDI